MDRFTKSSHFIPVKVNYSIEEYSKLYINEIVSLHGIPLSIISDRGPQLTFRFCKAFQRGLCTKVKHNSAFHPQKYSLVKQTIQIFEDMLRACFIDFQRNWDDLLPFIEFPTIIVIIEYFHGTL